MTDAKDGKKVTGPAALPAAVPATCGLDEAASLLGVSLATLRRSLDAGAVGPTPTRLGRRVLFSRTELLGWIEAGMPDRVAWTKARRGR